MGRLIRAITAVVSVAFMAAATTSPCAGWESTPEARQDCCKRQHCQHVGEMGQAGSSQASADQCCAVAERGAANHTERLQPTPVMKVPSVVAVAAPVAPIPSTSIRSGPLHPPGPVPIHLLHAVFRI